MVARAAHVDGCVECGNETLGTAVFPDFDKDSGNLRYMAYAVGHSMTSTGDDQPYSEVFKYTDEKAESTRPLITAEADRVRYAMQQAVESALGIGAGYVRGGYLCPIYNSSVVDSVNDAYGFHSGEQGLHQVWYRTAFLHISFCRLLYLLLVILTSDLDNCLRMWDFHRLTTEDHQCRI